MDTRVVLRDAFKTCVHDQDKLISPEETVRRFRERAGNLDLKILNRTERIDNGRLDIPVFFSECGTDARAVIGTNKQMGKGATPAQSEASAVMELAERFSFFSYVNQPDNFIVDTFKNVETDAIDFSTILRSVHDEDGDLAVKRRLFEDLPLKWARGFNLTRGREVLIPFNWFYMINEFNGPCAGNCVEEAVCQGICEIVERHVSSLVSHNRMAVPVIDPSTARDSLVRSMLKSYESNGISLVVSDFSLDMGVPTVGVLAWDPATFPVMSEIVWTAGTAPDPEKAMSRALTETAQLAGDFNTGSNYVASGLPKFMSLEEAGFITGSPERVPLSALPDISSPNIRIEVENCVSALSRKNMDVLLINTMHSGLRVPAFYTIVPGAHFRERAAGTSVGMFAARLITETLGHREALARLDDMERLQPGQYYTPFYQGLTRLRAGDTQGALERFETALKREPARLNIPDIASYMGVCLKEMGEFDRAIDILEQGEAIDSQRTDIYNLKGFCYFRKGCFEDAIRSFKTAVALDPGSAIDYANIATNYRELGQVAEAVRYYETALAIDPEIGFARKNLEKLKARK